MTRIDFHVLGSAEPTWVQHYVCRLVDKAWRQNHRILIHCEPDWLDALDAQLWEFREGAFIPHQPIHAGSCAVNLCSDDQCGDHHDVLINLSRQQPNFFSRFNRVLELVPDAADWKTQKREHFRFYQSRGYVVKSHRIAS